jgi:hypothetical protein
MREVGAALAEQGYCTTAPIQPAILVADITIPGRH